MEKQIVKNLDENSLFINEDIVRGKKICGSFNLKIIICVLIPEF
jgi:hypothetical protein